MKALAAAVQISLGANRFLFSSFSARQDEKKSVKKKRKRRKSSARRASDSSEEESDAESKVFILVTSPFGLCASIENRLWY